MDEERLCIACGARLAGPFQPRISLSQVLTDKGTEEKLTVTARSWICPGCGLVHWHTDDQDLEKLMDLALDDQDVVAQPGASYERRTQMLRMLRRVRRM